MDTLWAGEAMEPRRKAPTLPGVQATIAVMLVVITFLTVRVRMRQRLHLPPSTFALTATRWCDGKSVVSPGQTALFCARFTVMVWHAAILAASFIWQPTANQLVYFTVWNYILQLFWWIGATFASGMAVCRKASPDWLRLGLHHIFSVSVPASLLVSAVLWGVLLPQSVREHKKHTVLNFFSYNQHLVNTCLLLLELGINRLLIRIDALPHLILWTIIYTVFVWVHHASNHWWPYFFMRMSTWAALPWYGAILVLHGAFFGVALGMSRLKSYWQLDLIDEPAARREFTAVLEHGPLSVLPLPTSCSEPLR